jgi:predicted nucleotidyltransferase
MPLTDLFRSPALARLLVHFSLHPDRALHFRALLRHTNLGIRSLQTELRRLERLGLVRREQRDRKVVYVPESGHPGWRAIREMVARFSDPAEILDDALQPIQGIEAAFIFGSFARGDVRPDSDVDAMVIGEGLDSTELGRAALSSSVLLNRDVHILRHSWDSLSDRVERGSPFVRSVLAGPKRWIVGEERHPWGN